MSKKSITKTVTTTKTQIAEPASVPRKKRSPRKKSTKSSKEDKISTDLDKTLLKNLVGLQKVHTDLAVKFDKLTKEISLLLALFETTARTFAKAAPLGEYEKDKEFLEKIDRLLDQNKVLAKGLTLMEERLRERMYGPQIAMPPPRQQLPPQEKPMEEKFNPSIASGKKPLPRF